MKLNERIEQSIQFGAKEIKIRKEVYNKLNEETKRLLKLNNVKITFDDSVKEFQSIFQGGNKWIEKTLKITNTIKYGLKTRWII